MESYSNFAPFYRKLIGRPELRARRVLNSIKRYAPNSLSLLELGCGTGGVLSEFDESFSLVGLDRSTQMLAIARIAVPRARFYAGDMANFRLDEKFDAIICVFDGLNHLLAPSDWAATFECVDRHLVEGGLFIFDVSPIGRLARSAGKPPQVLDFEGNTLIIEGAELGENTWSWNIRVFEHVAGSSFRLTQDRITKMGLQLDSITRVLAPRFELLELRDGKGCSPTDESEQAYFIARRRD